MVFPDEWGEDPTVQRMRRIFSRMEKAQTQLMESLFISPLDPRLRAVRTEARDSFEAVWPVAMQKGFVCNDEQTALLYLGCLKHALRRKGFTLPLHDDPEDEKMGQFLKGILK